MNEPEFKTPAAVAEFLRKPVKTYVKLPGLLAFKVELPRERENRTIGAFVRSDVGMEVFEIWCDGKRVAAGTIDVGHACAIKMLKGMVHALAVAKGHAVRNRANRRARKAVAALFPRTNPNLLPLANPPIDERPTNPEDDE